MRQKDAVPDELEIIGDKPSGSSTSINPNPSSSHSRSTSVPKTVVEKVDPFPSHGEVPGTPAHSKRLADAVPDVVHPPASGSRDADGDALNGSKSPSADIPTTVITKVDSEPRHGEVPGTEAYDKRRGDAEPDVVEKRGDVNGQCRQSSRSYPTRAID